jgi:hypothetical protein
MLPLTHVGKDILECEHGGALKPRTIRLRRLMAALQNGHYIGYGHLHFDAVNGREKDVWPVALVPQMLIKCLDQTLVCSGGNGFEKPPQTPAL